MSSSTLRGHLEFDANAIARMRKAEEEAQARRLSRVAAEMAAKREEFARMRVANSDEFAAYAARCDALDSALPRAELSREHDAIVTYARAGNGAAAAARVSELERRADLTQATAISQRLVTEEILKRAGDFEVKAKEGGTLRGSLDIGDGKMPMQIVAVPPAQDGGSTRHEVVFETAKSPLKSCLEQHEAARRIVRAAGPQLKLDDPGDPPPNQAQRKRRKKNLARQAKANKTRRAG